MIELSPFDPDTSNTVDTVTENIQNEAQVKFVRSMARFGKQDKKIVRRIAAPYFIIWSVIIIPITCSFFAGNGLFGIVAFCGGILGYIGAFGLAARDWEHRLSDMMKFPVMLATSDDLALNQPLTVQYSQYFKKDLALEGIKAQLVLQEWVRYTQGTSTYTDTRNIVMGEDWTDAIDVRAGDTVEREFNFQVPLDAMHTWRTANNNRLHWLILLELDLPGWLDYKETYNIIVKPEVYAGDV